MQFLYRYLQDNFDYNWYGGEKGESWHSAYCASLIEYAIRCAFPDCITLRTGVLVVNRHALQYYFISDDFQKVSVGLKEYEYFLEEQHAYIAFRGAYYAPLDTVVIAYISICEINE